jgi:hypothetical protein
MGLVILVAEKSRVSTIVILTRICAFMVSQGSPRLSAKAKVCFLEVRLLASVFISAADVMLVKKTSFTSGISGSEGAVKRSN